MKHKINPWVIVVGMICITALEIYALSKGINGVILTLVVAAIATAIGVNIPKEKFIKTHTQ